MAIERRLKPTYPADDRLEGKATSALRRSKGALSAGKREVDEFTRDILSKATSSPEERRAAWQLRRAHQLDNLATLSSIADHLRAWSEGSISYRNVMDRCSLRTLPDLLAAMLNIGEPFAQLSDAQVTCLFMERILREHLFHEDRLIAASIMNSAAKADDRKIAEAPSTSFWDRSTPGSSANSTCLLSLQTAAAKEGFYVKPNPPPCGISVAGGLDHERLGKIA